MSGKFWGENKPACAGSEGLCLCGTYEYTAECNNAIIPHLFWNKPPLLYQVQIENDWSLYSIN